MARKFMDITKAGCAIKILVSNIEGKEYAFTHVPVNIKTSSGLDSYEILLLYPKDKEEEMLAEVNKKFEKHDVGGLLEPSENYVQLAFFEADELPFYKRKITFSTEFEPIKKGEMVSCIVDSKFNYIDEVMNRWFAFDEKLEVHKDDDIYQYIDCISKKREKKEKFVKRLFKSKKD
ncbi:MAG: hypothetical protein IJL76_01435 [Bacilli bacterium]|nr:hypothetical protein [Bacilli bacterium]